MRLILLLVFYLINAFALSSCSEKSDQKQNREVVLYDRYCTTCHMAPKIGELPKDIWKNEVLPRMAARMGVRNSGFDPKKGHNFSEQTAILESRIYYGPQIISDSDWNMLRDYIIEMAPDALKSKVAPPNTLMNDFIVRTIDLDKSTNSLYSFMDYDEHTKELLLGDMGGNLFAHNLLNDTTILKGNYQKPIVDYYQNDTVAYTTIIGKLIPSELSSGSVFETSDGVSRKIANQLHRPVNTLVKDLNYDGTDELVVSEFGHLNGQLSLLTRKSDGSFEKKTLLNQPGMLRIIAKDMNNDSKLDLIVASAQGDEGVYILYQEVNLEFRVERVLRFSPVYGTSWFELVDYDGDGDDDLITVNGDNADKSYVSKPYHGMRIHINDGSNHFSEHYFYPMNGATRVLAKDFDADNDLDIAIIATFPDYGERPAQSFKYLENVDSENFQFKAQTFNEVNWGRWFLMDAADIDVDGDLDIILSAFSFPFTKTPEDLIALWDDKKIDVVVLENRLNTPR